MATLDRWNDGRLDDLKQTVDRMIPVVDRVGVLDEGMKALGRDLRATSGHVEALRGDLKDALEKPVEEAKARASALKIGIICAFTGGAVTGIVGLIVQGTGH